MEVINEDVVDSPKEGKEVKKNRVSFFDDNIKSPIPKIDNEMISPEEFLNKIEKGHNLFGNFTSRPSYRMQSNYNFNPMMTNHNQFDGKRNTLTSNSTHRKSNNLSIDPNLLKELSGMGMSASLNKLFMSMKSQSSSSLACAKVTNIIKELNKILEPDQKITSNGRMIKETKLKTVEKEEKEIVKKLDECDKLARPEDYETGVDEDIVKKAIKLHQDHLKGNALIRNKNRKFREFGVKRIISLNDSSDSTKEVESKKMHDKIEKMLKMKPKYRELIADEY